VAINLSPLQFRQKGLVARAARILMEHRIDPELVEIELTESSLMHDVEEGVRCLEQLASYGLRLSLDDFGTGHSSLAYLRRFPLHALKIDRTFVWAATKSPVDAAIVRTIIQLAHGLGLRVVAEGVESEEQRRFLAAHDCDEMQGFLFGAPAPAAQAALRLAARRATPSAPGNLLPDPLDEPARLRA
jgi:EAL domain-containing protein (putative c-di-GMP-specific phosphodiesterase class I)